MKPQMAPPQPHPLQPFLAGDIEIAYFDPVEGGDEMKQKVARLRCRLAHIDASVLIVRTLAGVSILIERRFLHSIKTCSVQGVPGALIQ